MPRRRMPTRTTKQVTAQTPSASSVDALTRVLAIELITAARGLELRAPLRPGPAAAAVIDVLRRTVPGPGPDRFLAPEIEAAADLVAAGDVVRAAETVTGPLA